MLVTHVADDIHDLGGVGLLAALIHDGHGHIQLLGEGPGPGHAAQALVELGGAKSVTACASHGVLSGPAFDRINASCLDEVLFLNTIRPREDIEQICPKIKYLSVAHIFAEAIERIYEERSVSKLFN